ncbi:MAG: sulfotransferase [Salibacteraceae bacterium]
MKEIDVKYIFLLYDNRSGSTMISEILDSFDQIEVTYEIRFPIFILEYNKSLSDRSAVDYFFEQLEQKTDFRSYPIQLDEFRIVTYKFLERFTKENLFKACLEAFIELSNLSNSKHVFFKVPGAYYYVHEIANILPRASFLEIIRDGRAVFVSKRNAVNTEGYKMEASVINAALNWAKKMRLTIGLDNVSRIRFEDVVLYGETWLIDHLNSESVVSVNATKKLGGGYRDKILESQIHLHGNVGKSVLKSKIVDWKNEISQNELWVYNLFAKRQLELLGYEPQVSSKSITANRLIELIYEVFSFLALKLMRLTKAFFSDKSILIKIKHQFK